MPGRLQSSPSWAGAGDSWSVHAQLIPTAYPGIFLLFLVACPLCYVLHWTPGLSG